MGGEHCGDHRLISVSPGANRPKQSSEVFNGTRPHRLVYSSMTTPPAHAPAADRPSTDSYPDINAPDDDGLNVGLVIEEEVRAVALPETPQARMGLPCNVGRTEQRFRLFFGTGLLAVAAFAPVSRGWKIGLATIGAAELITGTLRYCPVSQALGINTCRGDE